MCGRVRIKATKKELEEAFDVEVEEEFPARYNLAPTEAMPVIVLEGQRRVLRSMRWGFPSEKSLLINARSESVAHRPAFSESFRYRRAIVPVDAFYEWRREGKTRQPLADGGLFAFAGLWLAGKHDGLPSATVLTTQPNDLVATIHNRMPVIVAREDYARWLNPSSDPSGLTELLQPFPVDRMKMYPVNPALNKSGYDAPECAEPWDETPRPESDIQPRLF